MKKRNLISLLAMGLLVSSCGGPGNQKDYENNPWDANYKSEKVYTRDMITKTTKITYSSANSATDVHGAYMQEMVDRFNQEEAKKHPGKNVVVEINYQGGYDAQNTKLQAQLMGNSNPEIAHIGVSSTPIYVKNSVDMRDLLPMEQLKDINEGFMQFSMYQDKFVGFPFYSATNVLMVNRTLLNKAQKNIPYAKEVVSNSETSTWTWDYMLELATAASDESQGVYGLATSTIAAYESFFSYGESIYNKYATQANFNNDTGKSIFQYWRDLVTSGAMKNPVNSPNHANIIVSEFAQGKVGLLSTSSSQIMNFYDTVVKQPVRVCRSNVKNDSSLSEAEKEAALADCDVNAPLFELEVLPFPKQEMFYANQSGGTLIVFNNKSDDKIAAASAFLSWLGSAEQVADYSSSTGYLPCIKSALDTEIWKEHKRETTLLDDAVSFMKFTPSLPLPLGRSKALADKEFSNYSKSIWYDNCSKSIDSCLKETYDRVNYILKSNQGV